MRWASRFFLVAGCIFAGFSAVLGIAGTRPSWLSVAPFDVLGLLPLLANLGALAAILFAAIFAAAAISCWLMVLRLWLQERSGEWSR